MTCSLGLLLPPLYCFFCVDVGMGVDGGVGDVVAVGGGVGSAGRRLL